MKMFKFGNKTALFVYFWARILKIIVIFEISTLEFVRDEFLTHTVIFWIGSAFYKGPGSTFFEGLSTGSAPFCKVSR